MQILDGENADFVLWDAKNGKQIKSIAKIQTSKSQINVKDESDFSEFGIKKAPPPKELFTQSKTSTFSKANRCS